jgi:hypothetical protein
MSNNDLGCLGTSRKRRRISLIEEGGHADAYGTATASGDTGPGNGFAHAAPAAEASHPDQEANISIPTDTKLAEQTVTPFLAEHIPAHPALLGGSEKSHKVVLKEAENANKYYCYRHRPGLTCRRQVDEPSMDQLQRVR